MIAEPTQPVEIFYSYAHEDERLRKQLENHLSSLKQEGLITGWYDRDIRAGTKWASEIEAHLNSARIILLLVSPAFMASEYCTSIEMKRALEREEAGKAHVIPIILRHVDWQRSPIGKLQALPKDAKPVTDWPNRDRAFVDIVKGIRKAIIELPPTSSATSTSSLQLWNLPYRRNPFFTGREDILTTLHSQLQTGKPAALTQPQAISGLGGIGKTQTAVEYAYRHRDEYYPILWATAATRESLIADYVIIAGILNLPEKNAQKQDIAVAAVKRWLASHKDWLLILDNADDLEMASDFLPTEYTGHVILTTRAQFTGTIANGIDLEKMDLAEGTLLLLRRARVLAQDAPLDQASKEDRATAEAIVKALDGLPLALDQVGAYIEETQCGLAGYLGLYQIRRSELLKRRSRLRTDHPEPVATTWSLSFQQVEQANPAAADLLRLCAFLDPDAIPEEIITKGASELGPVLGPVAGDSFKLNEAIEELRRFSLIKRNPTAKLLNIHRLVQVVLKDEMDAQTQRSWAERVIRAVERAFPDRSRVKMWSEWQRYLPQAQACAELIEQWNILLPEAAYLLSRAGKYLSNRSQFQEGEVFLKHAILVAEQIQEWKTLVSCLSRLAFICTQLGRTDEAEPYLQQSLTVQERMLGTGHPEISRGLEDLARLYLEQKRYEQAESLIRRALTVRSRDVAPKHLDLADILEHLAKLYLDLGQFDQAEEVMDQILAHLKQAQEENENKSYGDMHRWIGGLSSLVRMYMRQRKYEQAEPLLTQILEIWGQELEPLTAQSLNDLADIRTAQGEYEQAERLRVQALNVWEQIMVPGDGFTERTRLKLARSYIKQGKYEQTRTVYAQAIPPALNDATAYLDRGYFFLHLKNRESAHADFSRLTELQPKNVNAAWMAVYTDLSKQKPGVEIAERLETIARLDPQRNEAYVCRGVAKGLRGKLQEGLTELEHVLGLDARHEDALFWKGMMCACLGLSMTAREAIEEALQCGLPPLLLTPLFWLEQDNPQFYQEYAEPLLKQFELK